MREVYSYADLSKLTWLGDDQMEKFLLTYSTLISGFTMEIADATLVEFLLPLVKRSKVLQPDVAAFDRMEDTDPNRTSKTLLGYIRRYLGRTRQEKNRNNMHLGL